MDDNVGVSKELDGMILKRKRDDDELPNVKKIHEETTTIDVTSTNREIPPPENLKEIAEISEDLRYLYRDIYDRSEELIIDNRDRCDHCSELEELEDINLCCELSYIGRALDSLKKNESKHIKNVYSDVYIINKLFEDDSIRDEKELYNKTIEKWKNTSDGFLRLCTTSIDTDKYILQLRHAAFAHIRDGRKLTEEEQKLMKLVSTGCIHEVKKIIDDDEKYYVLKKIFLF